jgi:glycosidase
MSSPRDGVPCGRYEWRVRPWIHDAVLYQVYPRSFCDADGDGIGDLAGIAARLDHLAWLGVDALWMSPIFPSPLADGGYDASDYLSVHPELGTVEDLAALVDTAGRRGMRVLLDLVPNHTSVAHRWFQRSRSEVDGPYRRYYTWAPGAADGGPPNNWRSRFGGPAWTRDGHGGEWYLHSFLAQQPDLDWRHEPVRREFEAITRHWFEIGIAGFRLDVCYGLVRDPLLRDNPPARPGDPPEWVRLGQRLTGNLNQPDAHPILARWRRLADGFEPPRMLLGEVAGPYFGTPEAPELHLALGFPFRSIAFDADEIRATIERVEAQTPSHAQPAWELSNHDEARVCTRWGAGDVRVARAALVLQMTLHGTPCLYYGDELGMTDVTVPAERARDRARLHDRRPPRDPARTPMRWSGGPGRGFTRPAMAGATWLPLGDGTDVAAQRADPRSTLHLTRALIALRRRRAEELVWGPQELLDGPEGVLCYRRGRATLIAVNTTPEPAAVQGWRGPLVIGSDPDRRGGADGALLLRGHEAAVIAAAE